MPRLNLENERRATEWAADRPRLQRIDRQLAELGLDEVPARHFLEEIVGDLRHDLVEPGVDVTQLLDRLLEERLEKLMTVPSIGGPRQAGLLTLKNNFVLSDSSGEELGTAGFIKDEARLILRGIVEADAHAVVGRKTWIVAGVINVLVVLAREGRPLDVRLPWPKRGVEFDDAAFWPALWLSGQRRYFPLASGKDPSARNRSNQLTALKNAWAKFGERAALARSEGERRDDL